MNRREFLSVLGGASALSMINVHPSFATTADAKNATTSLYVKGLVMVDLGNPDFVRLLQHGMEWATQTDVTDPVQVNGRDLGKAGSRLGNNPEALRYMYPTQWSCCPCW
jgi:hypothetical protein